MTMIQPIGVEAQAQAAERVQYYIDLASRCYKQKIPPIDVVFNLRGKAAGMYRCYLPRTSVGIGFLSGLRGVKPSVSFNRQIRFNPWLFAKYPKDSYDNTIPHEVAHYVSDCLFNLKNIKPHGNEWKAIMGKFGAEPLVRGNYTLEGIPIRQVKRYDYSCACRQVALTGYRHRKIQQGIQEYRCRDCQEVIALSVNGLVK